jgi:hypothetical protein
VRRTSLEIEGLLSARDAFSLLALEFLLHPLELVFLRLLPQPLLLNAA